MQDTATAPQDAPIQEGAPSFVLDRDTRQRMRRRLSRHGLSAAGINSPAALQQADRLIRGCRSEVLSSCPAACQDLHEVAAEAAPARSEESAWPGEVRELSEKITRQSWRGLWPTEPPVRDRDRQMLRKALPPGVQVAMDDPPPYPC